MTFTTQPHPGPHYKRGVEWASHGSASHLSPPPFSWQQQPILRPMTVTSCTREIPMTVLTTWRGCQALTGRCRRAIAQGALPPHSLEFAVSVSAAMPLYAAARDYHEGRQLDCATCFKTCAGCCLLPSSSSILPQPSQPSSLKKPSPPRPHLPPPQPPNHRHSYVTVAPSAGRRLYYYLVGSESRKPDLDPLVIWLTGGPGCSSLDAFTYEHGPFTFHLDDGAPAAASGGALFAGC